MREPSCDCPICGWEGAAWAPVESRPNHLTNKKCVRCGSYPRDRLVWLLLAVYSQELGPKKLRLIEFGGSRRTYGWKKRLFQYWNVDIEESNSDVIDVPAKQMMLASWLNHCDVGLISYVLSMIESRSDRVNLMQQFHEKTNSSGRLVLFDDFSFVCERHVKLAAGSFFHRLRFGRDILKEIEDAGWNPFVVEDYVDDRRLMSLEVPFVLASKLDDSGGLREWVRRTSLT
jgi:hypothetical protein